MRWCRGAGGWLAPGAVRVGAPTPTLYFSVRGWRAGYEYAPCIWWGWEYT